MSVLRSLELGVTPRPFQADALRAMRAAERAGEKRLHVVAPPGAGKTVIGLAWALERGERAVVLSPTSTIAAQWVARFNEMAQAPLGDVDPDGVAGVDRAARPLPEFLSLTYQAVSVKEREGDDLHDNVYALFEELTASGVRSLILDECHHLLKHWADAIATWLERAPGVAVLGLTATPPVDASASERARHEALLGDVTYEIPLPALVRSGHLAPYQDLAWVVRPPARELAFLAAAHERFAHLEEAVTSPADPLFSLQFWMSERLRAIADGEDADVPSWAEWVTDHVDRAVAFGRVMREHGVALPSGAWALDEMEDPPTLDDEATVLAAYAIRYLLPLAERGAHPLGLPVVTDEEASAAEKLYGTIRDALAPVGFRLTRAGVQRRSTALDRLLGLSTAKYEALAAILRVESGALQDDLRAVVVVDFERASRGRMVRALEGVLDPEAGGAVSVLRYLASHDEHDALDAVMVTGRNLICDRDVADEVAAALRSAAHRHGWRIDVTLRPAGRLVHIQGTGSDWASSRYTLLVTELFERGVTRCIVGTRGLLGEGWDTRAANVLVDLTSVASFVSTNQLRGRCLRLDPDRPEKVANLWDVIAIAPDFERGFADWERFVRKHGHVFGVADDGAIEEGVGHVHPAFTHTPRAELASMITEINADMCARADTRPDARRAWRIGEPYENETVSTVELRNVVSLDHVALDDHLPLGVGEARAAQYRSAESASRTRARSADAARVAQRKRVTELRTAAAAAVQAAEGEAHQSLLVPIESDTAARRSWRHALYRVPAAGVAAAAIAATGIVALLPVLAAALCVVSFDTGVAAMRRARATRELRDAAAAAASRRAAGEAERSRLLMEADAVEAAAESEWRQAHAAATAQLERARALLVAPLEATESVELYATVLLRGFRRWSAWADDAANARWVLRRRQDGALAVDVLDAPVRFVSEFARAFRGLSAPIGEQRYLLEVPKKSLSDWTSASTFTEASHAYVPVPPPFDAQRSGADAFAGAWAETVGPAEVLYTRRGRGAEVRARQISTRWWKARTQRRSVWR